MGKICSNCGAPIADACRQCGKELKEGAKFCVGCGVLVEESSQETTSVSENDQVSVAPHESQLIIESSTNEITKPDNKFIKQAEVSSLTLSQNIAETVSLPINPPLSPAPPVLEAKKSFFAKKIYLGILGAVAVACVIVYMNVGILVIPPSEMIPEGISVVYWRNDTKLPFISSPESMLLEEFGEANFFTTIAILGRIADLVMDEEITRLPYNDWLYSKSLKGIKPADPSSPSAQATEPTEEPVALADEEAEERSNQDLPEEILEETMGNESQTLAGQTSAEQGQIKGTNVNMREYPSVSAQVIFRFPGWEYVTIHEATNPEQGKYPWFKVSYKNMTGWVYGEFVKR